MLQDQLIDMLCTDQEGLIRRETVILLTVLYDQDIHDNVYFMNIYNSMKRTMMTEKNEQVKIAVMNFWMKVVDIILKKHGMMDGSFPEVTFSKELKRIITFNKQKIRSCLSKALTELSDTGCLATYVFVLKNETDDRVYQVAERHLDKLTDLLVKYKMSSRDLDEVQFNSHAYCNSPSPSSFNGILSPAMSPAASVDLNSLEVEELLDSDCHMTNSELFDSRGNISRISPNEFLHFVYSEMNQCKNQHDKETKSMDDLDSLLQSILKV